MNFWQRAWRSVLRRRGKSLILFGVVFVLGNVIAGAVSIQQATDSVEKKVKADLGAWAVIDVDFEEYIKVDSTGSPDNLPDEVIEEIGNLSYVSDYDFSRSTWIKVVDFKTYRPFQKTEYDEYSVSTFGEQLELAGVNAQEPLDFQNKLAQLTDGRLINKEEIEEGRHVAVISNKVAEENGLSIGDEAILDTKIFIPVDDYSDELGDAFDFPIEVVGIFKPIQVEQNEDQDSAAELFDVAQYNAFYMPNKAVEDISDKIFVLQKEADPYYYYTEDENSQTNSDITGAIPTYMLKSPDDVEAFKTEVTPLLPEFYQVRASTDKYDEVGGSMNKLARLSGYIVFVAVAATLIIISLIVILFSRDRKHELGIYLSLGERRRNVVLQILLELLVVSVLAMALSLVTGNFLGQAVSDSLWQGDLLETASSNDTPLMYDTISQVVSLSSEDIQQAYSVELSTSYALTFMVVGILTVLGSAVLPLLYILRLNPKEILL